MKDVTGYEKILGIGVSRVDKRFRTQVPAKIVAMVPWMPAKEARAFIGVSGCIQIDDANGIRAKQFSEIAEALGKSRANAADAELDEMIGARLVGASWKVEFGSQSRFTIPEAIRALGILRPSEDREICFYANGNILEIWSPQALKGHLQELSSEDKWIDIAFSEFVGENTKSA